MLAYTIHVLIIGVGNPFKRDDGVGPAVASDVRAKAGPGARVLIRAGEGTDLIESWTPEDEVIIVDAMHSGAEPGTILRIDALAGPFPVEKFRLSSHSFGVAEAIEVARAIQRLPRSLVVFGVEISDLDDGEGLSDRVAASVPEAVAMVLTELRR